MTGYLIILKRLKKIKIQRFGFESFDLAISNNDY